MRWVVGALVFVAALGFVGIAFGVAGGLMSDFGAGAGAGADGRPFLTWTIALCFLGVEMIFWPALVSWYLPVKLPTWHRKWLVTRTDEGLGFFEDVRDGRRVVDMARSVEPDQRRRLASRVAGYGLFYVALTVPAPVLVGVGALRMDSFWPIETLPLILCIWIPALWIGSLVIGSLKRDPPGRTSKTEQ